MRYAAAMQLTGAKRAGLIPTYRDRSVRNDLNQINALAAADDAIMNDAIQRDVTGADRSTRVLKDSLTSIAMSPVIRSPAD